MDDADFPPPLSKEQFDTTFKAYKAGDEDAGKRIVESNLRYIMKLAWRYSTYTKHLSRYDLFQEGVIGMMKALETYDPAKGASFLTHGGIKAKWVIIETIKSKDNEVRLPLNGSKHKGWLESVGHISISHLDAPIGEDGESTLADILAAETLEPSEFDSLHTECLHAALSKLSPRQAEVLRLGFGFGGNALTGEEMAQIMGCSRALVSLIEIKAMTKLRKLFLKELQDRTHGSTV